MPKSKRAQVITLSKSAKKTKDDKSLLIESIQTAIETYPHLYIFSVDNMRNTFLKQVRDALKESSRFFFGKNRVMKKALGTNQEEAYKHDLNLVADKLSGDVGLLFSRLDLDEIKEYSLIFI